MTKYRFKMDNPLFDPNKEYTFQEMLQVVKEWTAEMKTQSDKWREAQKEFYQKKREQHKNDLEYVAVIDRLLLTYSS